MIERHLSKEPPVHGEKESNGKMTKDDRHNRSVIRLIVWSLQRQEELKNACQVIVGSGDHLQIACFVPSVGQNLKKNSYKVHLMKGATQCMSEI